MKLNILIIVSKFNDYVTSSLLNGAKAYLQEQGLDEGCINVVWVPGAFELPVVAAKAARQSLEVSSSRRYDAIICLGCIIRGDTPHFDFVANATAEGLMKVAVEYTIPVAFGVLTTDTSAQALERSGLKGGNKGSDAAATVLSTLKALSKV